MSAEIVDTVAVPASTEIVFESSVAALAPRAASSSLVVPAAELEKIAEAFEAYQALQERLLTPDDFQGIGDKQFKKKSAWRKMSTAFGCSTEIVKIVHERDQRGRIIRSEFVVRATAPNGRSQDGYGACDRYERCCEASSCRTPLTWPDNNFRHAHCEDDCPGAIHFSHAQHDVPATAETRAKNRALSDLFGFGEVSAEEVTDDEGRQSPHAQAGPPARPISEKQIPFLTNLLFQTGMVLFDLKDVIGAEVVSIPDLTSDQAKKAIDHCIGVRDGKIAGPAQPEHRATAAPPAAVPDLDHKLTSIGAEFKRRGLDPDARYDEVCKALGRDVERPWSNTLTEPDADRVLAYLNGSFAADEEPF